MSATTARNEIQVKNKTVETILPNNLKEEACLEQEMVGSISTEKEMTTDIKTIFVEGSNSHTYYDLLEYYPLDDEQIKFLHNLKEAVEAGVEPFNVPVCDPSIDKNGRIQFIAGCEPAVGYSYYELKKIASNNGVQLGSKNQYVLFLATIICRLIEHGWSKKNAFYAVCTDSKELGHYCNSANTNDDLELTGSREVVGKFDLANTCKVLAEDKPFGGFWIAGGCYMFNSCYDPLASLCRNLDYDGQHFNMVGWFVL